MKKVIVFDLDGTLAESKSCLDPEMSQLLYQLLSVAKVAVISGGDWPQFEKQLLSNFPHDASLLNLSLLPTCGTKYYHYETDWKRVYCEELSAQEKHKIVEALQKAVGLGGFEPAQVWGEVVEDRDSQITFSALGQLAPLAEKNQWDADFAKRKKIQAILELLLPEFSVRLGGTTSIDVTKSGVDKAHGIRKLHNLLGIPLENMLFVGDALFPGGNDYPVKEAGVHCIAVRGPSETKIVIETLLACAAPHPAGSHDLAHIA